MYENMYKSANKWGSLFAVIILLLVLIRTLYFPELPDKIFILIMGLFFLLYVDFLVAEEGLYHLRNKNFVKYSLISSSVIILIFLLTIFLGFFLSSRLGISFEVAGLLTALLINIILITVTFLAIKYRYSLFTKIMAHLVQNVFISRVVRFLENPKKLMLPAIFTIASALFDLLKNQFANLGIVIPICLLAILQPVSALVLRRIEKGMQSTNASGNATKNLFVIQLTYAIVLLSTGLLVFISMVFDFLVLFSAIKEVVLFYFG